MIMRKLEVHGDLFLEQQEGGFADSSIRLLGSKNTLADEIQDYFGLMPEGGGIPSTIPVRITIEEVR
jgi:hypothetical protein